MKRENVIPIAELSEHYRLLKEKLRSKGGILNNAIKNESSYDDGDSDSD